MPLNRNTVRKVKIDRKKIAIKSYTVTLEKTQIIHASTPEKAKEAFLRDFGPLPQKVRVYGNLTGY